MSIQITPQVFFELFILCLSWQWDESKLTQMWTTVDKVTRILTGLNILTDKQRKVLFKDRRVQSIFAMKCGYVSSNLREGHGDSTKHEEILASKNLLVVSHDSTTNFSRERMLRDYRIYMSYRGSEYALSLVRKFESIITRESYRAECERQSEEFQSTATRATVMKNYRAKIADETE